MSPLDKILTADEMKARARRSVPKMFFEYADSGSYTEGIYRENESDFNKIKLKQKMAVNLEGASRPPCWATPSPCRWPLPWR